MFCLEVCLEVFSRSYDNISLMGEFEYDEYGPYDTSLLSINVDIHPVYPGLVLTHPSVGRKLIKVNSLTPTTNIQLLSQDILDKCKLIPTQKQPEIEQLLLYLQKRNLNRPDNILRPSISDTIEHSSIENLSEYTELLYEDETSKIQASKHILNLARNPENLETLLHSQTLLGALSRVLRDDWKKSTELASNIVYIFFCFSAFSQFHQVITDNKIGGISLQIIEYELEKYKKWKKELTDKRRSESKENAEEFEKKMEVALANGDQLLRVTLYLLLNISEEVRIQMKMRQKGIIKILIECLKQDRSEEVQILVVSFMKRLSLFIENITEMAELGVVKHLDKLIPCEHDDLLGLTLRLLLNLSFHTKLRADVHEVKMTQKLVKLLKTDEHRISALCLLYQLSYDEKHRAVYAFVPELIEHIVAELLKPKNGTEPEPTATALLVNLCSNVACVGQVCKMHNGKVVKALAKRAFRQKSVLLMKMVRNMSQFDSAKDHLMNYIGELAQAIGSSLGKCYQKFMEDDAPKSRLNERMANLEELEEVEAFALECVGTLANVTNADLDYNMIIDEYNLWEPIAMVLDPTSKTPDDLCLEIIILLGTFCIDDQCANNLASKGLIPLLIELLKQKQEDDELVCQIVNVINRLITHKATRELVVNQSQAGDYIIDLMHDSNEQIRKVCDETLDLIAQVSPAQAEKIKLERFKWHNQQWLQILESKQFDDHFGELGYEEALYQDGIMGGHGGVELLDDPNDLYWGELDNQQHEYY